MTISATALRTTLTRRAGASAPDRDTERLSAVTVLRVQRRLEGL